MKKIFTLLAVSLFAAGVFAQNYALDANRILKTYIQNDGKTTLNSDEDHMISDAVTKLQFPMSGADAQTYYNCVDLTQNYSDPETGFSVPAGKYTTLCGYRTDSDHAMGINFYPDGGGLSNLSKIIIYLGGVNYSGYEGQFNELKITGTNIYVNGAAYTNAKGRNSTSNYLGKSIKYGMPADGTIVNGDNREFSQSKLFRVVIDVASGHNPDDAKEKDANGRDRSVNDDDNPTEKKLASGQVDATGHATASDCKYQYNVAHKFVDETGDLTSGEGGTPGAFSYDIPTSDPSKVGYSFQIKKYGHIFGIAFVCTDATAKTYEADITQGRSGAKWSEISPSAIQTVNAANTAVAPVKSIENGRVVISKNGHKYTAAGAMLK